MADGKAYPPIEPYETGQLKVDDIHQLYYEQSGNPKGKPVLFVHGGPGVGTSPADRCFFDPEAYRIILFDQRGAGHSTPAADIRNNNTWLLIEDIEKLREHLGIEKWVVFGGSWGSTLGLLYAETHPEKVKAIVLRGIWLSKKDEIHWLYQEGASRFFPDCWDPYVSIIPEDEREDLVAAYYKRMTSGDEGVVLKYARAWCLWENSTAKLEPDDEVIQKVEDDKWVTHFGRIECHYMVNKGFLETDDYIMDNVHKLKDIPCSIVQGRYDMMCPPDTALKLHRKLPKSELDIVTAGHSSRDPETLKCLVKATDKYKTL